MTALLIVMVFSLVRDELCRSQTNSCQTCGMSSVAQPHPTVPAGATEVDVKQALRSAIRSTRSIRSPRVQAEVAERLAKVTIMIPDVAQASCVALYASRAGEPGTLPLIEQLVAKGKRVLLPVLGPSLERGWAEFTDAEDLRERAPGRPPEPSGPDLGAEALAEADVVLAPALAVDTSGNRLGNGGGWYDRALGHARPGAPVIALVHAEEIYDGEEHPLPVEPHDRPVDAVATPEGWRWLRMRAAA